MTILELLTEALSVSNVIGVGGPVSAAHADTAFRALIGLTDTMNADPLKKLTTARILFLTQPGKLSYTIGADSSLDINKPRPQSILRANVAYANTDPVPLFSPIAVLTDDGYRRAQTRNAPAPVPTALWYDRGYSAIAAPADPALDPALPVPGYGTINLIGMPTAANFVELWAAQPLTQASSQFDDLVFPPAYYEYLLYGTTIRLYPRFARDADPVVLGLFKDAQIALESANAQPAPVSPLDSGLPGGGGGYWDGRTNSYVGRG
jgi:hypothetical protein